MVAARNPVCELRFWRSGKLLWVKAKKNCMAILLSSCLGLCSVLVLLRGAGRGYSVIGICIFSDAASHSWWTGLFAAAKVFVSCLLVRTGLVGTLVAASMTPCVHT